MNKENTAHAKENKIAKAIKRQWETLKDKQDGVETLAASERVKKVDIRKDNDGKSEVVVKTADGKELSGKNGKKVFTALSEKTERLNNDRLIDAFLERIKEEGFANVESQIPQYLREEVLAACRRENISLSAKGEKAERREREAERREREAEREERQREIAEAAERAANKAEKAPSAFADKDFAETLGRIIVGLPVVCHSPTGPGLIDVAFSIPGTQAVVDFEKRGGKIKMPPVSNIFKEPPELLNAVKSHIEEQTLTAVDVAASMEGVKSCESCGATRSLSNSITVVKKDGSEFRGQAQDALMSNFISGSFLKTCKEKGLTLADFPLADNQKNGFPANLHKKAKKLGLDPNDPATLEIVIKAIPPAQIGKINKDYFEKHFSKLSEKLSEEYKNVCVHKENILKTQEKAKALAKELKAKGASAPPELTAMREIKEKLAKELQENPYDLRKDAHTKGMTLNLLSQKEKDTRGINPLTSQNKVYKNLLELGALAYGIDRDKQIPPYLIQWAERNFENKKQLLPLRRQYETNPDELRKHLPPMDFSPAALEKRLMPEKLAEAARPEVLSPVNTDAGHVAAQLRKNAKKLTSPVRKKSLQETLGRKRPAPMKQEPPKKQMPQRMPADIARIKKIQDLQQARR